MPHDPETEDTDMMRIIGRWFGFDWEWMKHFTPYAQVILEFYFDFEENIIPSLKSISHFFLISTKYSSAPYLSTNGINDQIKIS